MGFSGLTLVTAPAAEPITTAEAKTHLRVDHATDDTYIDTLIVAARRLVESHTGRALVTQTWDLSLDGFPAGGAIDIPLPPLQSVTSIKYTDADNVETTWGSSNYLVDTARLRGRIVPVYGGTWPSVTLRPVSGVVVRFVAGYGTASAVPADIKHALKLWLGHLYEHREAVSSQGGGGNLFVTPMAVDALLADYFAKGF